MNHNPAIVVFSGVDAFSDERCPHSLAGLADVADRLSRGGIPLIFCSSHTRAEIEAIQHDAGAVHPFISENGAALFIPVGYFSERPEGAKQTAGYDLVEFGCAHTEVMRALHLVAHRLGVEVISFNDLPAEEIATTCELPLHRARLAKLREYDEPFRIRDAGSCACLDLICALADARLRFVRGDRFDHVNGALDASASVERLRSLYEKAYGSPVLSIGLGSTLCDIGLLGDVDLPIVVRNRSVHVTETLLSSVPSASITSTPGAAWTVSHVVRTIDNIRRSI